jgi:hypothetical protein
MATWTAADALPCSLPPLKAWQTSTLLIGSCVGWKATGWATMLQVSQSCRFISAAVTLLPAMPSPVLR